jgi:hypothetical protein
VSTNLTEIDSRAIKKYEKGGFPRKLFDWVLHWAELHYSSLASVINEKFGYSISGLVLKF